MCEKVCDCNRNIVDDSPNDTTIYMHLAECFRRQKDGAYAERNQLVAGLSKCFPSSLERHPDDDQTWENDWRWIVFIDLPTGQASWHIHDSELPQFDHLLRDQGRKWDGHTNEEKYQRLAALPTQERNGE